jgi:hypothetical protein
VTLSARELAALQACSPTLKQTTRGFITSPVAASCRAPPLAAHLVRDLVAKGYLAWGNASHRFATLTAAGGQAIGRRG